MPRASRRRRYRRERRLKREWQRSVRPVPDVNWDEVDLDDYCDFERDDACHYCGGDGWGIVGLDWDSDDPINGPYSGEVQRCPCCNGSGDAEDCVFW